MLATIGEEPMSQVRDQVKELRNHICRVAALTAALSSSIGIADADRVDRIKALAEVAEEYADENLALADRLVSRLDRIS